MNLSKPLLLPTVNDELVGSVFNDSGVFSVLLVPHLIPVVRDCSGVVRKRSRIDVLSIPENGIVNVDLCDAPDIDGLPFFFNENTKLLLHYPPILDGDVDGYRITSFYGKDNSFIAQLIDECSSGESNLKFRNISLTLISGVEVIRVGGSFSQVDDYKVYPVLRSEFMFKLSQMMGGGGISQAPFTGLLTKPIVVNIVSVPNSGKIIGVDYVPVASTSDVRAILATAVDRVVEYPIVENLNIFDYETQSAFIRGL